MDGILCTMTTLIGGRLQRKKNKIGNHKANDGLTD